MIVKIWGARGSLPAPHAPEQVTARVSEVLEEYLKLEDATKKDIPGFLAKIERHRLGGYGGNTPCVEIRASDRFGSQQVILDAGSGLRALGYELMAGDCGKGKGEAHIFFTHFHWDHLIGLPFFTPIFIPGNVIHVYAVQPELPEVFQTVFRKPYFPVPLEKLGARIVYHRLEPRKPMRLGQLTLTPYQLDHPDPCWGYRIECGGKSVSHCVDTECTRVSREQLGPDLPLYQDIDLMIFDAQYTLTETIEKVNWGHATASLGIDIALREKVKQVVFIHHDPASSDAKIAAAEAQARKYYTTQLRTAPQGGFAHELDWCFGYEGMTIGV